MIKTIWRSQLESNGHSHHIANAVLRNSPLAQPILQGKLVIRISMFMTCCCSHVCRRHSAVVNVAVAAISVVDVAVAGGGGVPSHPNVSPYWAEYTFASLAAGFRYCNRQTLRVSYISHGWGGQHESMFSFTHFTPHKYIYIYICTVQLLWKHIAIICLLQCNYTGF